MGALFVEHWIRSRGREQFEILDRDEDGKISFIKKLDTGEIFDLYSTYETKFKFNNNCLLKFESFDENQVFAKFIIEDAVTKQKLVAIRGEINALSKQKIEKEPGTTVKIYVLE